MRLSTISEIFLRWDCVLLCFKLGWCDVVVTWFSKLVICGQINWTWLREQRQRSRVLFGRAGRYQSWKLILVTERMMLACNINVVVPFVRDRYFHIAKLFFVSFHSTTISHFPWSSNLTLKQGVCVMRAYRPAAHVFGSSCSAVAWHVPAAQLVIACQHAAPSVHVLGLDKQTKFTK